MTSNSQVKSVWFLPRTRDRPVFSAITLGSVIESPWSPDEPLNDDLPPTVPNELLLRREESSWSWARETSRSRGGGVFASFLQISGIGGELNHQTDRTHLDVYEADRLVTEEFIPNAQYIGRVLEDPGVQEASVGPFRKSKVYIVTGLKIAYGATKATESMKSRGMYAQVGFDASALAAPVTVGPKGSWSSSTSEKSSAGKSDFVFGFRLRVLKRKKGRVVDTAYTRGAQYGMGSEDDGSDDEELHADEFELHDIEEQSAEEFRMQNKGPVVDGDEEGVVYFYPREAGEITY